MRLLRTDKLELKSFPDRDGHTPPYAILSHRWSSNADDEVLYHDIGNRSATEKPAHPKLAAAMRVAKEANFEWIWIDTCCIDKTSSAELTEAINSMYAWYEAAAVCYAYIDDKSWKSVAELAESKWFTRGWTLQELIAPEDVIFYDKSWTRIGSKKFPAIRDMICSRTTIDADVLTGFGHLHSMSIAKRMSWAARRQTTRPEDIAYCLMGIFGVALPMLYGEGGQNAFHRLQEQIMKDSNDHSIFAWTSEPDAKGFEQHGLLADSPEAFANNHSAIVAYNDWEDETPFQPSNRGLRIDLRLTPAGEDTFYAALNCPISTQDRGYHGFYGIVLKKLPVGVNQYARVRCHELVGLETRSERPSVVYVRQKATILDQDTVLPWHFFQPRNLQTPGDEYELLNVAHYPLDKKDQVYAPRPIIQNTVWLAAAQASSFQILKKAGSLSAVLYLRRKTDYSGLSILLGSISNLEVGFDAMPCSETNTSIPEIEKRMRLQPAGTLIEVGSHRVSIETMIRVDTPRKLYIIDITVNGQVALEPRPLEYRPPAFGPTDLILDAVDDFAADVNEYITGPNAARYRPHAVFKRGMSSLRKPGNK